MQFFAGLAAAALQEAETRNVQHQLMNSIEVMELSNEKELTYDEFNEEEEETDPADNEENEDRLDMKQEPF